jgi:hypothetical protein
LFQFENYVESLKVKLGEDFWVPSLSELTRRDISFYEIVQKPGDIVFVGYETYHWVFAPVSISL